MPDVFVVCRCFQVAWVASEGNLRRKGHPLDAYLSFETLRPVFQRGSGFRKNRNSLLCQITNGNGKFVRIIISSPVFFGREKPCSAFEIVFFVLKTGFSGRPPIEIVPFEPF